MNKQYSKHALKAFAVLLLTYLLILSILTFLQIVEIVEFSTETQGDLLPIMVSLPFVAFYLLVLIAATAGFARGAKMAKALPFKMILEDELKRRSMGEAGIKTKIRSGSQVMANTPYLTALTTVISSRVSILAVIDSDNKVKGVITSNDIIRKLQEEVDKDDTSNLYDRLKKLKVVDLKPRTPEVAAVGENLLGVIERMIQEQFTKLIVVKDKHSYSFTGTVDVLDLVGEIVDDSTED